MAEDLTLVTDAHREYVRKHRFPTCDTCGEPAVFSEGRGILHSTDAMPFGLPEFRDTSGHEPTIRKWNAESEARWQA